MRSGSCCPELCSVSRFKRMRKFLFRVKDGLSMGCLGSEAKYRILQASLGRHRRLVCAQTQGEEAGFIPDLVGSHLVLITSTESYHGLDNWQKADAVAEKDTRQCMDVGEHERYYGLGMHVLVTVCSRNTNVIMVLAGMLW